MSEKHDPEKVVREIKRRTRRKFSSEEKIRIVLEGLIGEISITELCRHEGIIPNLYYNWSKRCSSCHMLLYEKKLEVKSWLERSLCQGFLP